MPHTSFKPFRQTTSSADSDSDTEAPKDQQDHEHEYEEAPWRRRAYGSLLRTPKIDFVPARNGDSAIEGAKRKVPVVENLGEMYLSIVLGSTKKGGSRKSTPGSGSVTPSAVVEETKEDVEPEICPNCSLPLTEGHHTSIAHQATLEHHHPPHSLPRNSYGLKVLESQGWDPDSRLGLGKEGKEGNRVPLKVVEKKGREGVGVKSKPGKEGRVEKKEVKKLGAKEVRLLEEKERKARMRLLNELNRGW